MSSTALHAIFLTGLTLLHAIYLQSNLLPRRQIYSAIRANSNTLFAYSQQFKAAEVLHALFEDLSSACLDRLDNPPSNTTGSRQDEAGTGTGNSNGVGRSSNGTTAVNEWQETLHLTTTSISQYKSPVPVVAFLV